MTGAAVVCEVPHESHASLCITPLMSSIHSSISCILKNNKKAYFTTSIEPSVLSEQSLPTLTLYPSASCVSQP